MARLPQIGSDDGTWGSILNEFLRASHNSDGSLRDGTVSESQLAPAVQTKLNATAASGGVSTVNGRSGAVSLAKTDVGLANVDNTADASKPVSTATQSALSSKADTTALSSHTSNTNNPHAVTKSQIGLSNVDNTADSAKPISAAQQSALDNKAAFTHTHTTSQISDSTVTGRNLLTAADASSARTAIGAGTSNLSLGTTSATAKAGDYIPTKADVGLSNVDNTADANKPVSTAQQTAISAKADTTALTAHTSNTANPHAVTKAQVGLGNVQNQSILVLGPNDPVPTGTPAGTVIIRTS